MDDIVAEEVAEEEAKEFREVPNVPDANLTLISENSYDEADLDEAPINQVKASSIEE